MDYMLQSMCFICEPIKKNVITSVINTILNVIHEI
jgi:hypothetical protein